MYLEDFPTTFYRSPKGESILVTDFIRAIKIPDAILADQNLFEYYLAKDNETPEIISHKFYRSTKYHWVIMLVNKRFDVWGDYPKSDPTIRAYCEKIPGGIDGIHHYENENGICDQYTFPRSVVTNYEYHSALNEKKRMVKVLKAGYLSEFVSLYDTLMQDA